MSSVALRSSEIDRKPAHSTAGSSVSFAGPERVSGKLPYRGEVGCLVACQFHRAASEVDELVAIHA
jgi:hypothetical protein